MAVEAFKRYSPRLLAPFVLLVLATLGVGASAGPRPRPVVVGIVGDQTLSHDLEASYKALEKGIGILSSRRPDVVLHTGDLVESTAPPEQVRASYARAAGLLDRLRAPWYLTAGDHDVNPPDFKINSGDRSREALFQELYGARVPVFRQRPYYSFDVRGIHFVALYSQEVLHADPRWGNVFFAQLSDRQLAWLGSDLEAHRGARAVIVFLHQPLWYHWSGWHRVHTLLRRYPVAAVIAGHLHYPQDEGEIDGIRYLTVGATGGVTKEGSPNAGNLQAVTLLRVTGRRQVKVEQLPLGGGSSAKLTPREDMDRAQALDVQLGNLWDFSTRNPVFVKAGRLVDSCKDGKPARVRIDQIGNPIDLPLDLTIDFRSEPATVALESPGFSPAACPAPQRGGECLLTPGARTEISNTSSVTIEGLCPCAPPSGPPGPPLWDAALVPAAGEPPAPGTVLSLHLRTSFRGKSGTLFLEHTVQTTVAACP
jgi:predicted MPP superfamily phosphohydrolase